MKRRNMKSKTDYRMSGQLNSLLIAAILLMGTALYWRYQTQTDVIYIVLAVALGSLHLVAYIVLKEIGTMFDELKDKTKSDKEEEQLVNPVEPEPNVPPKTRLPTYIKLKIAGRAGKNAGWEKDKKWNKK